MIHFYFWGCLITSMTLNLGFENRKIEAAIFLAAASIIGAMLSLERRRSSSAAQSSSTKGD